jgi:hypothetical protein
MKRLENQLKMDEKKVTLELSASQYLDLVKLVYLGGMVTDEIIEEEEFSGFLELQQKVYAASVNGKGSLYIGYDKREDEYFLADDLEDKLMEILEQYDDSRFWENLIMRLTLRDLQRKYSEKELMEMPEDKGAKEMEVIHNYYISEFDSHDLENLKVVSLKKV